MRQAADAPNPSELDTSFEIERAEMVRSIGAHTGIEDPAVLRAFSSVPRHAFVPPEQLAEAYEDRALSIGWEQTISQPTMLAYMLSALALKTDDKVLEVGAGCGYAAALLAQLASEVHTLEIVPELAAIAGETLARLGIHNVQVVLGNGRLGLPAQAPFDKILVSAGADKVPDELVSQLANGGTIAIPVGSDSGQRLLIGRKGPTGQMFWETSISCIFVPLIGSA